MRSSLAETCQPSNQSRASASRSSMPDDPFGLGSDLLSLLADLSCQLQQADELTRLRSPLQNRASFRLLLDNGTVLKGRRFRTVERANQANALAPGLRELPFNRVLACRGYGRLEQWIEGEPLAPEMMTDELAHWAGDLLGRLHSLNWANCTPPLPAPDLSWYLQRIQYNLDYVVDLGALAPAGADRILTIASRAGPRNPPGGLVHNDFSAENIVIDTSGQPVVVDNEHLTLGALDNDLVRCWYRWPMTPPQRLAFTLGYRAYRAPKTADFPFWGIYTLSQSTRVRLRHGYDASQPLDALRRIEAVGEPPVWPQFDQAA